MTASNWLAKFLERAATSEFCTRIGCTTCGAVDFRRGLVGEAATAAGKRAGAWDPVLARTTADALAGLTAEETARHAEALRMVFDEMWRYLGPGDFNEIVEVRLNPVQLQLDLAPAGRVLQAMHEHSASRAAKRRAEAERNDPVLAKARREARKAERAAQRAEWKRTHPRRVPDETR